jgi:hypothetical protein
VSGRDGAELGVGFEHRDQERIGQELGVVPVRERPVAGRVEQCSDRWRGRTGRRLEALAHLDDVRPDVLQEDRGSALVLVEQRQDQVREANGFRTEPVGPHSRPGHRPLDSRTGLVHFFNSIPA